MNVKASSNTHGLSPVNRALKLILCKHQPYLDHPSGTWLCKLCGRVLTRREVRSLDLTEVDDSSLEFQDG